MGMKNWHFLRNLIPLAIVCAVLIGSPYLHAIWSEPTTNPTAGNVPTPINQSAVDQVKHGGLSFSNLVATNVLRSNKEVQSDSYCDAKGDNCFTPAQVAMLEDDKQAPPPGLTCPESVQADTNFECTFNPTGLIDSKYAVSYNWSFNGIDQGNGKLSDNNSYITINAPDFGYTVDTYLEVTATFSGGKITKDTTIQVVSKNGLQPLRLPTSATVSCTPSVITYGQSVTCSVTNIQGGSYDALTFDLSATGFNAMGNFVVEKSVDDYFFGTPMKTINLKSKFIAPGEYKVLATVRAYGKGSKTHPGLVIGKYGNKDLITNSSNTIKVLADPTVLTLPTAPNKYRFVKYRYRSTACPKSANVGHPLDCYIKRDANDLSKTVSDDVRISVSDGLRRVVGRSSEFQVDTRTEGTKNVSFNVHGVGIGADYKAHTIALGPSSTHHSIQVYPNDDGLFYKPYSHSNFYIDCGLNWNAWHIIGDSASCQVVSKTYASLYDINYVWTGDVGNDGTIDTSSAGSGTACATITYKYKYKSYGVYKEETRDEKQCGYYTVYTSKKEIKDSNGKLLRVEYTP